MNKTPKVSFAIPTYNNEKTLDRCLKSIIGQTYPNFEIIIVDGGSQDSTVKIASRYTTKVFQKKGSLGDARQVGVRKSSGEILAIFDSDIIIPSNDWLKEAVQEFKDRVGIVWPSNRAPEKSSKTTRCYFNLWRTIMNHRLAKAPPRAGGNALFSRRAIEDAGGFNRQLHFGEDIDLADRIAKLGYKIVFFDVPLIHDTMWSFREFLKKQIWGASTLSVHGLNILGLNARSAFFEQVILGFQGMVKGLVIDRDSSWSIFPLLIIIRSLVYAAFFLAAATKQVFCSIA